MTAWFPVLAGGVGGATITLLATEWRTWRMQRREDRVRFHDKRVDAAADVLKLAFEARRLQVRRQRNPPGEGGEPQLETDYRELVRELEVSASRFYLLFPRPQRDALDEVLARLDAMNSSARDGAARPADALRRAREALDTLSNSCREYLTNSRNG